MSASVTATRDPAADLARSYCAGTWRTSQHEASYRLPTGLSCELVASLVDAVPGFSDPTVGGLVRRAGLVLSPGVLKIRTRMPGHDDAWDGALDIGGDELQAAERITATSLRNAGASTGTKSAITEWTYKSRLNMARTLATLDWAGHLEDAPAGWRPQMLTLTLPGDWLTIAPTGKRFKELFEAWLKRWKREHGTRWAGCWKLEFQGRGAPHLHLYGNAPTGKAFREWLSKSWADTCGDPSKEWYSAHLAAGTGVDWREGVRGTDPRSVALYFLGKSIGHNLGIGKEYQHRVPEAWQAEGAGPGRFWGHRGMERVEVVRELDDVMYLRLRRLVRRWAHANGRKINAASWSRWQGYTLLHHDAPAWLSQALRWDALGAGDGDPPAWVDPATGERLRGPSVIRACGPVGILP
jgi:hypothetical protein